jgi:sialate O-acetylesterase
MLPPKLLLFLGLALLVTPVATLAQGEFRAHNIFSDQMVLQRDREIVVSGFGGEPGTEVSAEIAGARGSGRVTKDGWRVTLPPQPAGGPHRLIVKGPKELIFDDVLVGDIWLASGQSNMHMRLRFMPEYKADRNAFTNPSVRFIRSAIKPSTTPERDFERAKEFLKGWQNATPSTSGEISAVGWYFADQMQRATGVPVGLIHAAHGSTRNEAWMSEAAVRSLKTDEKLFANPADPKNPWVFYNGMIAPLIEFPVGGFIWYQAEANGHAPAGYENTLRQLIRSRRSEWKDTRLPFYFVQLPSFPFPLDRTGESWAWLREAQAKVAATEPRTGMAVALDLGEYEDIHPLRKREVGQRLAAIALADLKGNRADAEGPSLAGVTFENGKAILTFTNTGGGLRAGEVVMNRKKGQPPMKDPQAFRVEAGTLTGFTLAGPDGRYHDAIATLQGDRVILTSAQVPAPKYVRYAWANFSLGNLANARGVLASPFRTDAASMPATLQRPPYWTRLRDQGGSERAAADAEAM